MTSGGNSCHQQAVGVRDATRVSHLAGPLLGTISTMLKVRVRLSDCIRIGFEYIFEMRLEYLLEMRSIYDD